MSETALALPVLLLLSLGLFQAGWMMWVRVRLQAAAQEAARSYTVWQPEGEAQARMKALSAAALALRPMPRGLNLGMEVLDDRSGIEAYVGNNLYKKYGPIYHRLRLIGRLTPFPGLAWLWPQGLPMQADAAILREDTDEQRTAKD